MKFKTIIITGFFLLLISSLSIANPISPKEIPPQKAEQTKKKKPNFIQKFILKKIKKIEHDGEQASSLSQTSMWLGVASFVTAVGGLGFLAALAAIITGAIVLRRRDYNKKTKKYAIAGIALGGSLIVLTALLIGAYFYLLNGVGWI